MHIAQLFFHNSILIASRTTDFWCFLKELARLHRILIGFCNLFRKILLKREKTARIIQKPAQKQAARFFRLPALIYSSRQRLFSCFFLWCQWIRMPTMHNFDWKAKNQQESIKKTHKKQAARFLSPACFDMFEPSKAFSMFLFMMPANQAASHCNQNQNTNNQRHHLPVAFP